MKLGPIILFLSCTPMLLCAQAVSDVSTLEKRTATLDLARTLLTTKSFNDTSEEIARKNPFNPGRAIAQNEQVAVGPVVESVVAVEDRDRLSALAASVTPTGTMQLGGTPYLLFGQKKFKEGDRMPISFQGATYEVQISAIERSSFTLRLNKEEITRPIKPVANKP